MFALEQLTAAYDAARNDPAFQREFTKQLEEYVGRPSRLYFAERLTQQAGGGADLPQTRGHEYTGAHKDHNCIGQTLLTKRIGKTRIIAETGAGQHGVARRDRSGAVRPAVRVYMGEEDVRRQKLTYSRCEHWDEVHSVTTGSRTLRDAINEAMREWMATVPTRTTSSGSVVARTRSR